MYQESQKKHAATAPPNTETQKDVPTSSSQQNNAIGHTLAQVSVGPGVLQMGGPGNNTPDGKKPPPKTSQSGRPGTATTSGRTPTPKPGTRTTTTTSGRTPTPKPGTRTVATPPTATAVKVPPKTSQHQASSSTAAEGEEKKELEKPRRSLEERQQGVAMAMQRLRERQAKEKAENDNDDDGPGEVKEQRPRPELNEQERLRRMGAATSAGGTTTAGEQQNTTADDDDTEEVKEPRPQKRRTREQLKRDIHTAGHTEEISEWDNEDLGHENDPRLCHQYTLDSTEGSMGIERFIDHSQGSEDHEGVPTALFYDYTGEGAAKHLELGHSAVREQDGHLRHLLMNAGIVRSRNVPPGATLGYHQRYNLPEDADQLRRDEAQRQAEEPERLRRMEEEFMQRETERKAREAKEAEEKKAEEERKQASTSTSTTSSGGSSWVSQRLAENRRLGRGSWAPQRLAKAAQRKEQAEKETKDKTDKEPRDDDRDEQ